MLGEEGNVSTSDATLATLATVIAPKPAHTIIGDVSKETIIKSDRQRPTRSRAPKPKVAEPKKEKSIKLKVTAKSSPQASSSKSKGTLYFI
jgi:hypothetical protein